MIGADFARHSLGVGALATIFTGCGGSQPPIGAPGAMATGTQPDRWWAVRRATSSDLLYVIGGDSRIYMLSYPGGDPLESFSVRFPNQLCSDNQGNVFVTLNSPSAGSQISEYPHGAMTPIKTLSDPGDGAIGCSVDPTTGNLAVANGGNGTARNANVVIYPGGSGSPETLTDPSFSRYEFCGYDNEGNLFVDGNGPGPSYPFRFAKLPKGSSTFTDITLDKSLVGEGSVQWDGQYITVGVIQHVGQQTEVYRVAGSSGHVIGTVTLKARKPDPILWIQGNRIIGRYAVRSLGLWKYPAGGRPVSKIGGFVSDRRGVGSTTISVAPKT
jgi:hypothetical protein